jgi:hypothetical protein
VMKCDQCGIPAIVQVAGHPLCVSCHHLFQQTNMMHQNMLSNHMNSLLDQMEMTAGVPGLLPRHKVMQPNIFTGNIHSGDVISIDRSVVGSVNTGNINNLEVVMNDINSAGNIELVKLIKEFIEQILKSDELSKDLKDELVEQVGYITGETLTPKDKQKPSIIKATLKNISTTISTINGLSTLWDNIHKHLRPFGIEDWFS